MVKLQRIQYRYLRIYLGSMGSTLIFSLEVTAGALPLYVRINELSCRFLVTSYVYDTEANQKLDRLFDINFESKFLSSYRECLAYPPQKSHSLNILISMSTQECLS